MKRKIVFCVIILFIVMRMGLWSFLKNQYAQYRAVQRYAAGDFEQACTTFESQLINAPHDDALNYNVGVAHCRKKNYETARDAFMRASQSSDVLMQEKAHFNLGNTQVFLEQLEEAIKAYEQVLKINPDNERAQHNLKLVQEMLRKKKEQEQEQKKQDQKKSEQEKNQDQSEKENSKDQNKDQKDQGPQSDKKKNEKKEKDSSKKDSPENSEEQSESEKEPGEQKPQQPDKEQPQDDSKSQEEKQNEPQPKPEDDEKHGASSGGKEEKQEATEREQDAAIAAQELEKKIR